MRHTRGADNGAPSLEASDLTCAVDGRTVFCGVDLRAEGGRVVGVRGPSGAGKSTLLAALAGLVAPDAGTVHLDGRPLRPGDALRRRKIGLVLQGFGLISALTVHENVAMPMRIRRVPASIVAGQTDAAVASVGLGGLADRLITDISGGQQQRTAIARALAGSPPVVIADEPTSELDADNRERVIELLVAAARSGAAVVVAAHDPAVLDRCDSVLVLG